MNDKDYKMIPNKEEYIPRHASLDNWDEGKKDMNHTCKENNNKIVKENDFDMITSNRKVVRKKKRVLKRWVWTTLLVIFLALIIWCVIKLLFWKKDNNETAKIIDTINSTVVVSEKEDDEDTELIGQEDNKENDYWYYITFPFIDVDIMKLKEINSDTIGYINVNNTNINYPYVQYKDNDYYLNHSYDGSYNEAGWVFMDYRNNSDLNNKNTILYAHSRLDKTMFGSLSKALKSNWYTNRDNHIIRLSTENDNTLWQIFSIYKIKEESFYIKTNFSSDNDYQKFLNIIKGRSIYSFDVTLTSEDRILTLSTCYSDTERTVVHAKLIKKSPK